MTTNSASFRLGVVADTHVPGRAADLHPQVVPVFKEAGVLAILHAGDISVPRVLADLAEVAPVHAVRGNRENWRLWRLPQSLRLKLGQVEIGLFHGHGTLLRYGLEYLVSRARGGLPYDYFLNRVRAAFPEVRVVVFGHLHRPLNQWDGDRLLFNPGSACRQISPNIPPSLGLLHIGPGDAVRGEIVFLSRTGI